MKREKGNDCRYFQTEGRRTDVKVRKFVDSNYLIVVGYEWQRNFSNLQKSEKTKEYI